MLVFEFAFSDLPENTQVILIPPDVAKHLISLTTKEEVEVLNDEIVEQASEKLKALVTGLCDGVGAAREAEAPSISEVSVSHRIFSFPSSLAQSEEIIRVQIGLSGEDITGTATWLLDEACAASLLGAESQPEQAEEQQDPVEETTGGPAEREPSTDLRILMDIPLEVSVELGRTSLLIQDVVDLTSGSIVELEKAAGEPVDVLVNGRLVARGEVVVIEDNFGVRITEILSPQDRLTQLGDAA
ncbi:MAG: flagellar motor switch protein FliN [Armatimonadetes bacterium]|nr:flagellar motor switch protein FliN [Armatimonadota bacterium]